MFHKVLIANRGEVAVRLIKACHSLGLQTVAVFSTVDRGALFTRLADQAICIGGPSAHESYLNAEALLMAGIITHADALHPGYGFLAENANFARMVAETGMQWIGPQPAMIELMADKRQAKELAFKRGVPILSGLSISRDEPNLPQIREQVGYPLMLKASHGGGGKGMRVVANEEQLLAALKVTAAEAAASFDNQELYVEQYLTNARHVEVQVLGTDQGIQILGDRDCSLQHHKQKVIEESPAAILNPQAEQQLLSATKQLLAGLNYHSLGTVEYLYADGKIYFLEMNTRMQVEHGVTELTTGIDVIQAQIQAANGQESELVVQTEPKAAIECRLTVTRLFAKTTLTKLVWPANCRVDTGYQAGDVFPVQYDGLLAKILVVAATRQAAVQKMAACLAEIQVDGVSTNLAELQKIIATPTFLDNQYSIQWLDQWEAQHESLSTAE